MSEPLTTHEIEDVVSSIRRLVSDELRPIKRVAAPAKPVALILTPALRVVPDQKDEFPPYDVVPKEVAAEEVVSEEVALEDAPFSNLASDDTLPDPVENAVDEDYSWTIAPPTQDYDDQHPAEDVTISFASEELDRDLVYASAESAGWGEVSDEVWTTGTSEADEGAESQSIEEHGPDLIQTAAATVYADLTHSHLQETGTTWDEATDEWLDQPPAFVAHARKPTLAIDPLARAWADKAEAEVRAGLDKASANPASEARKTVVFPPEPPVSPKVGVAPEVGLFDGSDPELDEEALREVVREIIREELSGALGERITRNVRKLVRVEINRALTAREFE